MTLYKQNGEKAGFYDLIEEWLENYPLDIFVKEDSLIHKISELMIKLLELRKK